MSLYDSNTVINFTLAPGNNIQDALSQFGNFEVTRYAIHILGVNLNKNDVLDDDLIRIIELAATRSKPLDLHISGFYNVVNPDGTEFLAASFEHEGLNQLKATITEQLVEIGVSTIDDSDLGFLMPIATDYNIDDIDTPELRRLEFQGIKLEVRQGAEVIADYAVETNDIDPEPFYISEDSPDCPKFAVVDAETGKTVECFDTLAEAKDALSRLLDSEGDRSDEILIRNYDTMTDDDTVNPDDSQFAKTLDDINTTPTSGMRKAADVGLRQREEYGRGGTAVGVARARDISNGKTLSESTVKRMHSFFSRHAVNKKAKGWSPGEDGYPSAGRIAWNLWGGDPGESWARAKTEEFKRVRAGMSIDTDEFGSHGGYESSMVALVPKNPEKYVLEDGLEISDLHVTLRYLGSTDELDQNSMDGCSEDLERWCQTIPEFSVSDWTIAYFGNKQVRDSGQVAVVAHWDNASGSESRMSEIHNGVCEILDSYGLEDMSSFKDEPWRAHMTLGYFDLDEAEARFPEGASFMSGDAITFRALRISHGNDNDVFEFGSSSDDSENLATDTVEYESVDLDDLGDSDPMAELEEILDKLQSSPELKEAFKQILKDEDENTLKVDPTPTVTEFEGDPTSSTVVVDYSAMSAEEILSSGADNHMKSVSNKPVEFRGVAVIEGLATGDGRYIEVGALGNRELPLPFMHGDEKTQGHLGARLGGLITEIEYLDKEDKRFVIVAGHFRNHPFGEETRQAFANGDMRGVSVDLSDMAAIEEFVDDQPRLVVTSAKIMGMTGTPFPAFENASVQVIAQDADTEDALVASGVENYKPEMSFWLNFDQIEISE